MKRLALLALVLALPVHAADLVFVNGTIHTLVDERASTVEALAVDDGAVVAAGSREEIERLYADGTRVVDLNGATVVPGLVDAHAHLQNLGEMLASVNLRGATSAAACVDRARAMHAELPEGAWLVGRAWDQNDWDVKDFPTAAMLDAAFGDRPVYFERVDGHASWVSSAALRRAGITRATADPPGGEILRDAAGNATGILVDEADVLVSNVIPAPSDDEIALRYRRAIRSCVELGITGVHEMGVDLRELAVLRRGEDEGWLDLRVIAYLAGDSTLTKYEGGRAGLEPSSRLRVEGVKLYADGALGSRGAALLEDYADRPGHRGLLLHEPEALQAQIERVFARGMGLAVHAIGDRANRVVLDRIVAAHAAVASRQPELSPLADLNARIEHAQIVHPDDLKRFAEHDILPSMQPTHCTSDMPWAPARLGPDRLEGAYAWRTLRELGLILPFGSDFPVEETSPWLGLYAAVTRQQPDGTPPGGWAPHQRMTALEALLGFTVWASEAIDVPQWGTLGVGSRADLVVVDHDPLTGDAAALLDTRVMMTVVDGEVVFER